MSAVNHAPQGLEMCGRVKYVYSINHARQGLENMVVNTYQI